MITPHEWKLIEARFEAVKITIDAHEELDMLRHRSEHEALNIALTDNDRRLGEMNKFRDQISQERAEFMRRDMYDREHGALSDRVKILEITKGEYSGKSAAYASIAAFIGVASGILAAVFSHFWNVK